MEPGYPGVIGQSGSGQPTSSQKVLQARPVAAGSGGNSGLTFVALRPGARSPGRQHDAFRSLIALGPSVSAACCGTGHCDDDAHQHADLRDGWGRARFVQCRPYRCRARRNSGHGRAGGHASQGIGRCRFEHGSVGRGAVLKLDLTDGERLAYVQRSGSSEASRSSGSRSGSELVFGQPLGLPQRQVPFAGNGSDHRVAHGRSATVS